MKKRLSVTLVLVLLLAACIPVDDLGSYWDKGTIDPTLVGVWRAGAGNSEQGAPVTVAVESGSYRIDSPNESERKNKNYRPTYGRTLTLGPYTFFMEWTGGGKGTLTRYSKNGTSLNTYGLKSEAVHALLKSHPAEGITTDGMNDGVRIAHLNAAAAFLASIPDNDSYWKVEENFVKLH